MAAIRSDFKLEIDLKTELTRRIKGPEALAINQELKQLTDVNTTVQQLKEAVKHSEWESNSTLNHIKMPFFALIAYQENIIPLPTFLTLLSYWSVTQCHSNAISEIKTHALFEGGTLREDAQHLLIGSSFIDCRSSKIDLTREEWDHFFKKMLTLPRSEHVFVEAPYIYEEKSIVEQIYQTRFNMFGRTQRNTRLVPSFGMMQTYLDVKFDKVSVQLNPVLGLSSVADIQLNGRKHQRDMAFHFPMVFLPKKADFLPARWYWWTYHEFYHAALASCVPDSIQNMMIDLSEKAEAYQKSKAAILGESKARTIRHLSQQFSDMELVEFKPGYADGLLGGLSDEDKFWLSAASINLRPEASNSFFKNDPSRKPFVLLTDVEEEALWENLFYAIKEHKEVAAGPMASCARIQTALKLSGSLNFLAVTTPDLSLNLERLERMVTYWHRTQLIDVLEQELKPLLASPSEEKKQEMNRLIEDRIKKYFTPRNIASVFDYANQHQIRKLQQCCMIYITQHLTEVIQDPKFIELRQTKPMLIKNFLLQLRKSRYFRGAFKNALAATPPCAALELLLPPRSEVNQLDEFGFTALDYAIQAKRIDVVKKLLALGANPMPQAESKALPTAFSAIYHASFAMFSAIAEAGFNLDYRYQNQTFWDYYCNNISDPKTVAGISQRFFKCKIDSTPFSISTPEEAELFALAQKTSPNSNMSSLSLFPQGVPRDVNPALLPFIFTDALKEMDWTCQRIPVKSKRSHAV